jgi:diguanylate cyclase (GGDEF)-like protein
MVFATMIGLVCLSISCLSTMAQDRLLKRYEKLALTDDLTALPNRRFFLEQGSRLAKRIAVDGTPACVLIMDLDRFASINERFGHAGGDLALVAFATALRSQLRPTDLAARYGGEEFCAFLAGADMAEGARIAERLRTAVAELTVDMRGREIRFTVSVGLVALQGDDLGAAIEQADAALYQAKREGRNRVAIATADSGALQS